MKINIKKVLLKEVAHILFKLDNKIYICNYHRLTKDLKTLINKYKNYIILMVYDNYKPIGFTAFEDKKKYIEIFAFGFLPEYQKKGIGKLLFKRLLKEIQNKPIQLLTHPLNSSALIFYLKNGFEIYDWLDNYHKNGQPRLLLKR